MPIKVLIVDDSALVRQMLTKILNDDPGIEVVGVAQDPYIARNKIKRFNPDVLTLDVEMPRMDGITFLENLMRLRPMPVVMVSSQTQKGVEVTLKALELGAIDFIPKGDGGVQEHTEEIIAKVKMAARARVRTAEHRQGCDAKIETDPKQELKLAKSGIIALGASTGGTEAIADVLKCLPKNMPGIVITQHILDNFSHSFAANLNKRCALEVTQAEDGQVILPGHAYVAPGNLHLQIKKKGSQYVCSLSDAPPYNRHKPSVDVMFKSIAQNVGSVSIGVILTGMGGDGAKGLGEMKESGAKTLAQDESTSVVWGMPGEAVKLGVVDEVLSLQVIAERLVELSK